MNEFVKNQNGNFSLGGRPYRFIGANVYELANLPLDVTQKVIDEAASTGFKVLRFWLFKNRDTDVIIKKLSEICGMAKPYGIKLIVSLSDKWGYLQDFRIDDNWYEEGYKTEFLDYAKAVTKELSERDEIMIWELINEPEAGSFKLFRNFISHTLEEIKQGNQNHMFSVGTVGGIGDKFGNYFSVFKKSNFRDLYSLPGLDAVSLHDYSYDSGLIERLGVLSRFKDSKSAELYEKISSIINIPFDAADRMFLKKGKLIHTPLTLRALWNRYNESDIRFAASVNKPVYIGEVGFKAGALRNRKKILELDIERKFKLGVSGYILWSFQSHGWNNDGHGYGFGVNDGFGGIIKKWNEKFTE